MGEKKKSEPEKVIGFYSKAGGGHKAGLYAILEESNFINPNIYTQGYDFTSKNGRNYGPISEQSYTNMTENFEPIWNLFCWSIQSKLAIKRLNDWVDLIYGKNIENIIKEEKVEMKNPKAILIFCTYYFIADIIARRCPDIPVENIKVLVTDNFSPENVWFGSGKANYIVLSEEARQKAMDFGVPGSNIQYNGPVFNSRFNESKTDNQNKEFATSKGLDLDLPIVEIISGGASLPKGFEVFKETLEALESNQKKFQIVLICGRNESLKQRAKKLLSQYPQLQKFVKIEGFSTEIYDWMNIATIIVSKAGPGIMQEAWALCKPFFACNRIWPQEQMNFDLINQKEVGVADMDPRFLIKEILRCVNDKNELKTYRDNLLALDYRSNINEVTKGILGVE